jgi:iron complex transport system permease protein
MTASVSAPWTRIALLAVLAVGATWISLLAGPTGWNDPNVGVIFREIRVPATLTAVLAGAALAVAGLSMQTYFRNPLAGPDVMGVSAGAGLGVAIAFLAGPAVGFGSSGGMFGALGVFASASLGAMGVLAFAVLAARRFDDPIVLLILGMMFGALAMGMVGLLVAFARPTELQAYIRWTLGSFDLTWRTIPTFAAVSVPFALAGLASSKTLDALQLGETDSAALGTNPASTRWRVLTIAAVLSGVTTAACGPIAFIGVAAPHLARVFLRTSRHAWLAPGSLLIGVAFACFVLLFSKLLVTGVALPINTISGVFGAPIVIWMVTRLADRR